MGLGPKKRLPGRLASHLRFQSGWFGVLAGAVGSFDMLSEVPKPNHGE